MSLIDEVINYSNIESGLEYLSKSKTLNKIEDKDIKELNKYLFFNTDKLIDSIKNNTYIPSDVELESKADISGTIKTITTISSIDKLVSRMFLQVLDSKVSNYLCKNSFAYQNNKGLKQATMLMKEYLDSNYCYILNIHIKKFIDNISHKILIKKLKTYIDDDSFLNVLSKFIKVNIKTEDNRYSLSRGLLEESILTSLLSEIYLISLDKYFYDNNICYIRYFDEIRIFANKEEDIANYKTIILDGLKDLTLEVDNKNTKVINSNKEVPSLLNCEFIKIKNTKSYEIRKLTKKNYYNDYSTWNKSVITKVNDEYHIVSDGILNQENYNFIFENDNNKENIVLNDIDNINIYSNVVFSKNLFNTCYSNKLILSFYNNHNEFLGSFVPSSIDKATRLSISQLKHYVDNDLRLYLAKQFVLGAASNINSNLKYYYKHNNNDNIKFCLDKINDLMKIEQESSDINTLLSLEANVRKLYYSCFNDITNTETFIYKNRTRRPPLDPINALISFGNIMLYRYIAKIIYNSRLDIKIGYLHSTNDRNETLNLDISEIFKPIIIDKIIFSLINRHEIKEELHFEYHEDNACYLNFRGRKIFIKAFEDKMNSKLKINNKYYSYSDLIKNEIYKLSNHFSDGNKYKPYKHVL